MYFLPWAFLYFASYFFCFVSFFLYFALALSLSSFSIVRSDFVFCSTLLFLTKCVCCVRESLCISPISWIVNGIAALDLKDILPATATPLTYIRTIAQHESTKQYTNRLNKRKHYAYSTETTNNFFHISNPRSFAFRYGYHFL